MLSKKLVVRVLWGAGLLLMLLVGQVSDPTVNTPVETGRGAAGLAIGEDHAKPLPTITSADDLIEVASDGPGPAGVLLTFGLLAGATLLGPCSAKHLPWDRGDVAVPSLSRRAPGARRGPPLAA